MDMKHPGQGRGCDAVRRAQKGAPATSADEGKAIDNAAAPEARRPRFKRHAIVTAWPRPEGARGRLEEA